MENKKVWLVTGASKGIGLSLVKKLIAQGHRVAATSRNAAELKTAVGSDSESFLPLAVDITSEESVGNALDRIIKQFGRIDVLVNNAGYGQLGALEELTDAESRSNFDINVFGSLNVIRKVMPQLRSQASGHIINISSIGGYTGSFAGWGIYCATKFAVVGFTEALAEEVKEFGINVTAVMPGYFRTNFLDAGSLRNPAQPINEYTAVRQSEAWHHSIAGKQPGNPELAADAIIELAAADAPPVHLLLGTDAYDMALEKMESVKNKATTWKALSASTDF